MSASLTIFTLSPRQRLMSAFFGWLATSLLVLGVYINPDCATDYFIESNLNRGYNLVLCVTTFSVFRFMETVSPGLSRWQVKALFGAPRFKEPKFEFPGCSVDLAKADEVWFYEVAPHCLMLIGFDKNRCIVARCFDGYEAEAYVKWKIEQINSRAVGMTVSELESWLGPCRQMRNFLLAESSPGSIS